MTLLRLLAALFLAFGLQCSFVHAQPTQMRTLVELINQRDSAGWRLVSTWLHGAKNKVQVLPKIDHRADSTLLAAHLDTRSPLGAVIYETGGLLIDHGWLRVLGSGHAQLNRDVVAWNRNKQSGLLLVADDVLGGFFALNSGAFGPESLGKVFYLAPDNLRWQPTELTYPEFLEFCFSGDLTKFYKDLRWPGWQEELEGMSGNEGWAFYPYLFTREGRNICKDTRKVVPINELWTFYINKQRHLVGGGN